MPSATRYIRRVQKAVEDTASLVTGPNFAGATIVARVRSRERVPCVLSKSNPSRQHRVSGLWLLSPPAQLHQP
jgi:hypothetical protein